MDHHDIHSREEHKRSDPNGHEIMRHYLLHGVLPPTVLIGDFNLEDALIRLIRHLGDDFASWEEILYHRSAGLRLIKSLEEFNLEQRLASMNDQQAIRFREAIHRLKNKTTELFLLPLLKFHPFRNTLIRGEVLRLIRQERTLPLTIYFRKVLMVEMLTVHFIHALGEIEIRQQLQLFKLRNSRCKGTGRLPGSTLLEYLLSKEMEKRRHLVTAKNTEQLQNEWMGKGAVHLDGAISQALPGQNM